MGYLLLDHIDRQNSTLLSKNDKCIVMKCICMKFKEKIAL